MEWKKTKTKTPQKPNMLNCADGALNVDMFYLITYLEFHYIYILLAAFHSLKLLFWTLSPTKGLIGMMRYIPHYLSVSVIKLIRVTVGTWANRDPLWVLQPTKLLSHLKCHFDGQQDGSVGKGICRLTWVQSLGLMWYKRTSFHKLPSLLYPWEPAHTHIHTNK